MLGSGVAMLQTPVRDGLSFDPFVGFPDRLTLKNRLLRFMTLVPLRDRLQLERRAFDDPILLTLFGKLIRCQVPERAMGSALIVINPPCFDLRFRIC